MPFSWIYFVGYKLKLKLSKTYKSSLPVICIGGVVTGGSGKTPVLQAVIKLILEKDIYKRPVILTRGYGGKLDGPTQVDVIHHSSDDVGDEALMHTRLAPVIVSKNRSAGAKLAEAMGADVIVMDDGLQNYSLHKDISFLVIDSRQGLGNKHLLPAGPLREPYDMAVKKCVCVIETGEKTFHESIKTTLHITSNHNMNLSYFGFAGLGRPEKFKQTLLENGFKLAGFKSFPDHFPYSDEDIKSLLKIAGKHRLITTEKDAMRISNDYKHHLDVLTIELIFDDVTKIIGLLK